MRRKRQVVKVRRCRTGQVRPTSGAGPLGPPGRRTIKVRSTRASTPMSSADFAAIIPIVIVTLSACAAMFAEAFRAPGERMPIGGLAIIGLVGAAVASVLLWNRDAVGYGVIHADNFSLFINLVLCAIGLLTVLISSQAVQTEELPAGEYYALTLFGIAGMMMMAAASDLLVIFLALEILSLSVYVLTGLRRSSMTGAEAALKSFLLVSSAIAFFLSRIAFTFAVTHTTLLWAPPESPLGTVGKVLAANA